MENLAQEIIDLRTKRKEIQAQINEKVDKVKDFLKKRNKNAMQIGRFSVRLAQRIKRDIDFKYLEKMVKAGEIPETKFKPKTYHNLMITSTKREDGKEMKLKGNKFVYK